MKLFNLIKRLFKTNETKKIITQKEKLPVGRNKTRIIRYPKENPFDDILSNMKRKNNREPRTGLPFLIKKNRK
tara:strand:+ start:351 stop:569 length:219 start_codon:yes stop_codon:yes gene_type:complete